MRPGYSRFGCLGFVWQLRALTHLNSSRRLRDLLGIIPSLSSGWTIFPSLAWHFQRSVLFSRCTRTLWLSLPVDAPRMAGDFAEASPHNWTSSPRPQLQVVSWSIWNCRRQPSASPSKYRSYGLAQL